MSDDDKELVVVEDNQIAIGSPIDRDLVVSFADSLMGIHPAASDVGVVGMRTVAQLALMTGANPFPGTNGIHAWKDKGKICIQFGIGFWRSEIEFAGGILWVERPRMMTPEERQLHGVAQNQLGSFCKGALKNEVFSLMRDSRSFGIKMTIQEAKEEVARIGIGIAGTGEYAKKGRPTQWSADQRAERDLVRKLVPISNRQRNVDGGDGWSVSEYVPQEPTFDVEGDINSLCFGDDEPQKPEKRRENARVLPLDNVVPDFVEAELVEEVAIIEHEETPKPKPEPEPEPEPEVINTAPEVKSENSENSDRVWMNKRKLTAVTRKKTKGELFGWMSKSMKDFVGRVGLGAAAETAGVNSWSSDVNIRLRDYVAICLTIEALNTNNPPKEYTDSQLVEVWELAKNTVS